MKRKFVIVMAVMLIGILGSAPLSGVYVQKMVSDETASSSGAVKNNNGYDFLIITPSEFALALQPLILHKDSHGVQTILVMLDEIYNSNYFPVQGRDDAEKVKYFIKDAVEEWGIKYVMLVGGRHGGLLKEKWWCPVRYVHLDDKSNWEVSYLSDLYFADIYDSEGHFSSWDSNGNGIFGEWKGNKAEDGPIDLKPDVYVGRLACRTEKEVEVMVNKIIEYENTTYGQDWFNKMVVAAGDTYPEYPTNEGELGTQQALDWMPGFTPIKLWTSTGTLTGEDDVINAVSQGCGFLFFDGHGNPMTWATHPPGDGDTWIDGLKVQDMKKLSNDGKYPVCVVGGCHNSQFNVSVLNYLKLYEGIWNWYEHLYKGEASYECFSWWLTSEEGGGSIATTGYSGLGYTKEDKNFTGEASEWIDTHFFWEYGMNGTDILGEIWGKVIDGYLNTYPIDWNQPAGSFTSIDAKTAQEWILLGDPTLKIGGYP